MQTQRQPTRALVAYCVLADRLRKPGTSIYAALTPFFAPVCRDFSGKLFDASEFSNALLQKYGIRIPRLAALGLAEQLEKEGLLESQDKNAKNQIYRYRHLSSSELTENANEYITEAQIRGIVSRFSEYAKDNLISWSLSEEQIEEEFLSRLLNLDSMRILGRRETTATIKRTSNTLQVHQKIQADEHGRLELHLDFLVSDFLLNLCEADTTNFELVSNIAFGNMVAETVLCLTSPPEKEEKLSGLTVYLDSPLLLDMLRVNTEYADYGLELLKLLKASGAKISTFDHCINEAEASIAGQLSYLRSGLNGVTLHWGTSTTPDLLAALSGNLASAVSERLAIEIRRDPEIGLHKKSEKSLGTIQTLMQERMKSWGKEDARDHDQKSILSLISLRSTFQELQRRLCNSSYIFLTRNSALVSIANDSWRQWLTDTTKHSHTQIATSTPIAMSDKQFAGYLWIRSGEKDSVIPRARLIAHCSAAIKPRSDVKSRVYNLLMEVQGKDEAEIFAALVTDREGARALMRATSGDPEDATAERLPYILDSVRLAAGEYAAAEERKNAAKREEALIEANSRMLDNVENDKRTLSHELEKVRSQLAAVAQGSVLDKEADRIQRESLQSTINDLVQQDNLRRQNAHDKAVKAGRREYSEGRALTALMIGLLTILTGLLSDAKYQFISTVLSFTLAVVGWWFVPEYLSVPLMAIARRRYRLELQKIDPNLPDKSLEVDFREKANNS